MYQADRGDYRTKETVWGMFYHSCLGKIIILGVLMGILTVIAYATCPSEQYMRDEMTDNIRQCIEKNDSSQMDQIDSFLANIGYIFTTADSVVDKELMNTFYRHNRLEVYNHGAYITMYVFNNLNAEGIRCGIGIFGVVIPTIDFNDLLLRVEPVRREYERKTIETVIEGEPYYFGETPNLIFKEDEYY
ncbi:MAG: hypothetical protein IJV34_07590 [Prevotella sp.]|nr:hypothetical protein [Prevotella sp.]